jgi:hypothetical protein
MTVAIEATGLTKDFEKGRRTIWQRLRREPDQRETFRAVDGIDLSVAEGEVFGAARSERRGQDDDDADARHPARADIRIRDGARARPRDRGARHPPPARGRAGRRAQPVLEADRPREPRVLRRPVPRPAARNRRTDPPDPRGRSAHGSRGRLRREVQHRDAPAAGAGPRAPARPRPAPARRADCRPRSAGGPRPPRARAPAA